jgi:hypothetical protein
VNSNVWLRSTRRPCDGPLTDTAKTGRAAGEIALDAASVEAAGTFGAIARGVSAEALCEALHKPLPRKRQGHLVLTIRPDSGT